MGVINLDDRRKIWRTDAAGCAACGHQWQAVYPEGAQDVGLLLNPKVVSPTL